MASQLFSVGNAWHPGAQYEYGGRRLVQVGNGAPPQQGLDIATVNWPLSPYNTIQDYEPPGILDRLDWVNLLAGGAVAVAAALLIKRFA